MSAADDTLPQPDQLSMPQFQKLRETIHALCGIALSPDKKVMAELRLSRRVKALRLPSLAAYCTLVFGSNPPQEEIVALIDVITTNKTDFFREPEHFRFLTEHALPELLRNQRRILGWSAACSSGEEPYTLAMVLSEYAQTHPGFSFELLATDISTDVLGRAHRAIYPHAVVDPVPAPLRKRYLLRSRDREQDTVRISPELRQTVQFRRLNFMDARYDIGGLTPDFAFCRNALIYFDRPTQQSVVRKLAQTLRPGGFLFVGHSESLSGMDLPLRQVANTIYRKAA